MHDATYCCTIVRTGFKIWTVQTADFGCSRHNERDFYYVPVLLSSLIVRPSHANRLSTHHTIARAFLTFFRVAKVAPAPLYRSHLVVLARTRQRTVDYFSREKKNDESVPCPIRHAAYLQRRRRFPPPTRRGVWVTFGTLCVFVGFVKLCSANFFV